MEMASSASIGSEFEYICLVLFPRRKQCRENGAAYKDLRDGNAMLEGVVERDKPKRELSHL